MEQKELLGERLDQADALQLATIEETARTLQALTAALKASYGQPGQKSNKIRPCAKRLLGQFFTTTNPFVNEPFLRWFKAIPGSKTQTILEPFAGANNIIYMLRDLGIKNNWASYDIEPVASDVRNAASDVEVIEQDTLNNFPTGFRVAITNPPYLAKNSATTRGLPYAGGEFDDVYKNAISVMLANTEYVAAIIPESFITSGMFHQRLHAVVSLTCRMFDDTEVPVCLALFVPKKSADSIDDFSIWSGSRYIGMYSTLRKHLDSRAAAQQWRFNDSAGVIGLYAADDQFGESVRFVAGRSIEPARIKSTSRHVTRISLPGLRAGEASAVIAAANDLLKRRRDVTQDVFMTAFKGLRTDGKYRRRLDWAQTRTLLNEALAQVRGVAK